jgi:hypothetical protein
VDVCDPLIETELVLDEVNVRVPVPDVEPERDTETDLEVVPLTVIERVPALLRDIVVVIELDLDPVIVRDPVVDPLSLLLSTEDRLVVGLVLDDLLCRLLEV